MARKSKTPESNPKSGVVEFLDPHSPLGNNPPLRKPNP